jgi:hypothetical protein
MDISILSLSEIKAMAYDCLKLIELNQNNLKVINGEVERRESMPSVTPALVREEVKKSKKSRK